MINFLNSATKFVTDTYKCDITNDSLTSLGFVYSDGYYTKGLNADTNTVCIVENRHSFLNSFTSKPINRWQITIASIDISNDNSICKDVRSISEIVDCMENFNPSKKKLNLFLLKFVLILILTVILCFILNSL